MKLLAILLLFAGACNILSPKPIAPESREYGKDTFFMTLPAKTDTWILDSDTIFIDTSDIKIPYEDFWGEPDTITIKRKKP